MILTPQDVIFDESYTDQDKKPSKMKILVADDHAMIREGVSDTLRQTFTDVTIHEAENASAILDLLNAEHGFNVAMVDLFMPDTNGFSFLRKLCNNYPELPVIVLSASENPHHVAKALDSGAVGYIPKSASKDVMISAIRLVLSGGIYIPNEIRLPAKHNGLDVPDETGPADLKKSIRNLTTRQLEILKLLAVGRSNKQIARDLNLSENTVKVHVSAILKTLNLGNRTQAGVLAEKEGLSDSPWSQ